MNGNYVKTAIQNPSIPVGDFTCIADAAFESHVAHLCSWNGDRLIPVLTCGEQEIQKVLAIMPDGKTGAPCGACRELMVQMMPEHDREIEIMLDYEREKIVTLGELTPAWWIQRFLRISSQTSR